MKSVMPAHLYTHIMTHLATAAAAILRGPRWPAWPAYLTACPPPPAWPSSLPHPSSLHSLLHLHPHSHSCTRPLGAAGSSSRATPASTLTAAHSPKGEQAVAAGPAKAAKAPPTHTHMPQGPHVRPPYSSRCATLVLYSASILVPRA